ncbi:DUF5336 domain-containing protein [Mycobacterium neglectum]|uniref:DUF5336 domain-containing protein n=1 Tax=Mycobacterium neglectum TaxID=242737 RepID=UPI00159B85A8|nr:DUF5336 domain-containing protein [Mycobacterium neglectum]
MVYPPSNPDFYNAPESRLSRTLLIVVAALGLVTYCMSFGPMSSGSVAMGWHVRFAAMAALCGVFSVATRQIALPVVTAVLAAMGFLDGLSTVVAASGAGWVMTAIVVVNALQAAAAIAAVLLAPKDVPDQPSSEYEAYVDYYNQAVRNYYTEYARSPESHQYAEGYGQADASAQGATNSLRTARSSQHADYSELNYERRRDPIGQEQGSRGSRSARPAGLPSFGATTGAAPSYADQPGHQGDEPVAPPSPN